LNQVLLLHKNHAFHPHLSYTFRTMMTALGIRSSTRCRCGSCPHGHDGDVPKVFYCSGEDLQKTRGLGGVLIHPSGIFGEDYLTARSLDQQCADRIHLDGIGFPVILGSRTSPPDRYEVLARSEREKYWVASEGKAVETNIDPISASFLELSLYREVIARELRGNSGDGGELDQNNREPLVDAQARFLGSLMERCGCTASSEPKWPGGHRFAVCLTHDIDQITARTALNWYQFDMKRRGGRRVMASIPSMLPRFVRALLRFRSPFWTFDKIRSIEKGKGVRSSFFFIPFRDGSSEHDYGIAESKKVQGEARDLSRGGWEVGLHTVGDARIDGEARAMSSLGLTTHSVRYHRLKFRAPESWERIEEAGLLSDCSVGYNGRAGFRAGTCFPFMLFDPVAGREVPVMEVPLSLMDSSFYWYQEVSPEKLFGTFRELLDVVEDHGGVLVILWHNNFFDDTLYREWADIYSRIIDMVKKRGAFIGTVSEVSDWWRNRMANNALELVGGGSEEMGRENGRGGFHASPRH